MLVGKAECEGKGDSNAVSASSTKNLSINQSTSSSSNQSSRHSRLNIYYRLMLDLMQNLLGGTQQSRLMKVQATLIKCAKRFLSWLNSPSLKRTTCSHNYDCFTYALKVNKFDF